MSNKPDYLLFDKNSQALIYGFQVKAIQRMLDFDYLCNREKPSVKAIVNPTRDGFHKAFFGEQEILIPMYRTTTEAIKDHSEIDVMINFASYRSAYETTIEALENEQLKTIIVIAEGIPERKARIIAAKAKELKKWIIGPATVGGILAGQFKIANTGGTVGNILSSKLNRPGSVGFVSKSGGMSNEMYNVIARNADGIYEGVAVGGDAYPGSTIYEHIKRYEKNPNIKMIVVLGEVGGTEEYKIVEAIKKKEIKKPLIAWVTGTCAKEFTTDIQFGHAGAKSGAENESAYAKNKALKEAGAIVPQSFNDLGLQIKEVYDDLRQKGIIGEEPQIKPKTIPDDYALALKEKKIRKPADVICSISCDTGEEATYFGEPISSIVEDDQKGIGYVIGLLWFKKQLPDFACKYIEMILETVADHGPCVSGAHNTIVTARAGKDLISSLASGLLTIGPRFGGAIDGAAHYFKDAFDRDLEPLEFAKEMKKKGINIPGIGHKIKSVKNPDARVVSLKKFVAENFKSQDLLNYALEVEKITTAKKGNLILNVDGCIGITFVDMMNSLPDLFNKKEINEAVEIGCLNGLFVLGRSIGLMGHFFDQKRLEQGLYRYPMSDVCYMNKGETN